MSCVVTQPGDYNNWVGNDLIHNNVVSTKSQFHPFVDPLHHPYHSISSPSLLPVLASVGKHHPMNGGKEASIPVSKSSKQTVITRPTTRASVAAAASTLPVPLNRAASKEETASGPTTRASAASRTATVAPLTRKKASSSSTTSKRAPPSSHTSSTRKRNKSSMSHHQVETPSSPGSPAPSSLSLPQSADESTVLIAATPSSSTDSSVQDVADQEVIFVPNSSQGLPSTLAQKTSPSSTRGTLATSSLAHKINDKNDHSDNDKPSDSSEGDDDDEEDEDNEDDIHRMYSHLSALLGNQFNPRSAAASSSSTSSGIFGPLIRDLNGQNSTMQLAALQELSEHLSIATEDMFVQDSQMTGFHLEETVTALLRIVKTGGEGQASAEFADIPAHLLAEMGIQPVSMNPELIVLSCRCLANLMEALPSSSTTIVRQGGPALLISRVQDIGYIDLAEQILGVLVKLSSDYPSQIVSADGMIASLQYIDFFNLHVQRTAVSMVANACTGLSSLTDTTKLKEVSPILQRLLEWEDVQIVEKALKSLCLMLDWTCNRKMAMEFVNHDLLASLVKLGKRSLTQMKLLNILIPSMSKLCKAEPRLSLDLVKLDILSLVESILSVPSSFDGLTTMAVSMEQLECGLDFLSSIFPPKYSQWKIGMADNAASSSLSSDSKALTVSQDIVQSFDSCASSYLALVNLLLDLFQSTPALYIRKKLITCIARGLEYMVPGEESLSILTGSGFPALLGTLLTTEQAWDMTSAPVTSPSRLGSDSDLPPQPLSKKSNVKKTESLYLLYCGLSFARAALEKAADKDVQLIEWLARSGVATDLKRTQDDLLAQASSASASAPALSPAPISSAEQGFTSDESHSSYGGHGSGIASMQMFRSPATPVVSLLDLSTMKESDLLTWIRGCVDELMSAFQARNESLGLHDLHDLVKQLKYLTEVGISATRTDVISAIQAIARRFVGDGGGGGGITGFEMRSSGFLVSFSAFCAMFPMHVESVFLDENQSEDIYVADSFAPMVSVLVDLLSKIEKYSVLSFNARSPWSGSSRNSRSMMSSSLSQLKRSLLVELEAVDPTCIAAPYRRFHVRVPAIARLKSISTFLRRKLRSIAPSSSVSAFSQVDLSGAEDSSANEEETESEAEDFQPTAPLVVEILPDNAVEASSSASVPAPFAPKTDDQQTAPIHFSCSGIKVSEEDTLFGILYRNRSGKHASDINSIWNSKLRLSFAKDEFDVSQSRSSAITSSLAKEVLESAPEDCEVVLGLLSTLYNTAASFLSRTGRSDSHQAHRIHALFQCPKITAKVQQQLNEPLPVICKILPSWIRTICLDYMFLLPFSTRMQFLACARFGMVHVLELFLKQFTAGETGSHRGSSSMLVASPPQRVKVHRDKLLPSLKRVMELFGDSCEPSLEVEFTDEVGTGLGPTLEFYALCCSEVRRRTSSRRASLWRDQGRANADDGEFIHSATGLFPRPDAELSASMMVDEEDPYTLFKALGNLIAKGIVDTRRLDLPLNSLFLDMAIHKRPLSSSVDGLCPDLKLVDPELFASCFKLLAMDAQSLAALELDFSVPGQSSIPLIPGGTEILVTADNLSSYLSALSAHILGIERSVEAFVAGFNRVFPISELAVFSISEVQMLFSGSSSEDWSEEVILDAMKADHGYTLGSRTIQDMAQMMSELSASDRRAFLNFVTGSPNLPIGGFKALVPPLTVVCKQSSVPDSLLPSVMTCVHYVKVPAYSSLAVMKDKFMYAMREGQGAFHLS